MTTETPCLSGCQCACGNPTLPCVHTEMYELHAPNCLNAKPAEPPACEMCGQRQRLTNRPICAECDVLYAAQVAEHLEKGRWFPSREMPLADPQSEPRIEHRDVCHISYPCEDCGRIRSKAEGGTVFTICDDCWDRRSEPPSEPPMMDMDEYIAQGHAVVAKLKAERDEARAWAKEAEAAAEGGTSAPADRRPAMASKTVDGVRQALLLLKNANTTRLEKALVTEGLRVLGNYAEVQAEYEKALKDRDDDEYRESVLREVHAWTHQINFIAVVLRTAGRMK